jgi:hypothetical protein
MSHEHTELTPGAPRGRGWPRRLWIIAAGALIVLLAGGLCVYCLTHPPRPWPESDRETFGTEEGAKTFAFNCLKWHIVPSELARLDFNKEALATFDPETGYWTVTWTHANPPPTPGFATVIVVSYTPSTHTWHMVSRDLSLK